MGPKSAALPLLVLVLAGCSGGGEDRVGVDSDDTERSSLPVLTLGKPLLEIGEFEGGGDQTLDFVTDVRPLPDGRLAVVDQGAYHVRVFDAQGALLRTIGRNGDGPGEFRRPGALMVRDDSLWVTDERDRTLSVFSLDGQYARQMTGPEFSGDERFPLNALFHGRFWLDRVMEPARRESALRVAASLEYPLQRPGFRMARSMADGSLWVLERVGTDDETSLWMRTTEENGPDAMIEIPAAFDPMWVQGDEVLGVWSGEFEVNYIRRYPLQTTERSLPAPAWLAEAVTAEPPSGTVRDSLIAELKTSGKLAATAQEIYYAEHGSYTLDLASAMEEAEMVFPLGIGVEMLRAHSRGHQMIMTAPGLDGICGLAYGNESFSGVFGGAIVCGNEDGPTWWDKDTKGTASKGY